MDDSSCRARPGHACECCSCRDAERDTDPAPAPDTHAELRLAARLVLDAWISECEKPGGSVQLYDFCTLIAR